MKTFFGTILLALALIGTCSAHGGPIGIDELVNELNAFLDSHANYFSQTFEYPLYMLHQQSQQTGQTASYVSDRRAGDHVIKARSNYTTTVRGVLEIMNSTRDEITNDILSKKRLVVAMIPEVETVSYDLTQILRNRKCPSSSIASFLSHVYEVIRDDIQGVVQQATMTYSQIIHRNLIPIYLIDDFFMKIQNCLFSFENNGLKCLLRTEDFYLSPSVNMVRESANRVAQFLVNFNYRIAQALINDVEHELIHAYQSVYKYDCFNTTAAAKK